MSVHLDRAIALGLVLLSLPLFAVLALAVWITSGRPVLYRGTRLGYDRKPFTMYKFRTLTENAHREIGGRLFNGTMDCVTPLGKWLRATRLDELPQLWNIIRGEMRFVGPRPERPEVYEAQCREIRGYDKRFRLVPGLIGYAQVFTPHGTPKTIRTKVDNRLTGHTSPVAKQARFVCFTAWIVATTTVEKVAQTVGDVCFRHFCHHPRFSRRIERIKLHDAWLRVVNDSSSSETGEAVLSESVRVLDISESAFRVRVNGTPVDIAPKGEYELRIELAGPNGHPRIRRARCRGVTVGSRQAGDAMDYIITYEGATPLSDYNIQQHFLRNSMAPH